MIVERDNIGIFGKMNSGKSTLMNLITQQLTSIVDSTPGTTADTKVTLHEIHGMGPVRLFDTAGADELNELGEKKKKKVFNDLKECDLVIVVIDPSTKNFDTEKELIEKSRELDKQILVVYNLFDKTYEPEIKKIDEIIPLMKFYKSITINANSPKYRQNILNFILENFESKNTRSELLPFIEKNEYYVLMIPMDDETPQGRYLRPQAMCEEYITRNWAYPISFRMDLKKARGNSKESSEEKKRFDDFLTSFLKKPKAIITDSQAMDIMKDWTPKDVKLTTFSIVMINHISKGRLKSFIDGTTHLDKLDNKGKVLIVEACNHSRIGEDIGTVQIPNYLKEKYPHIEIEHNFGREFQENNQLQQYSLIIHCGGCMISSQKLLARIRDLESVGIPFTNYGLFLSYMQGKNALEKVLEPWSSGL